MAMRISPVPDPLERALSGDTSESRARTKTRIEMQIKMQNSSQPLRSLAGHESRQLVECEGNEAR
jgi:hypothetical protein